jgi:hypothetical protein
MKKTIVWLLIITTFIKAQSQELDITLLNSSKSIKLSYDTLTILQDKDKDNIAILKMKVAKTTVDFNAQVYDYGTNTAVQGTDYSYIGITLANNISFDATNNRENLFRVSVPKGENGPAELFASFTVEWPNLTDPANQQRKTITIKIIKKEANKELGIKNPETGRMKDNYNYFKAEVVQYSDIAGIKNDKPNGLLQFQGIIKIPINNYKTVTKSGWFHQSMRALLVDVLINRIDKSKEEVDYNYTAFLYENDKAKKTTNPWLATTDIWRFSNLQIGLRLVPVTFGKDNFRIQLQTGIKLLKNLPFTEDTIRAPGPDSGKVKADFRSVYSYIKYIELFFKYYDGNNKVNLSLNAGLMWLRLMDSYYEQIDIYQQDPFQKTIALAPITNRRNSQPMWFASLRLGKALGKEETVTTFLRVNYTLQKGKYLKPLSTIIDGRPVVFEEKSFYNNFFQVHLGTTFDLDKIFSKKEDDKKKGDGPISNSN